MRPSGFTTTRFHKAIAFVLLTSVPFSAPPVFAQKADCPTTMGNRADNAEDKISTWKDLIVWHHDYSACDDGETADGVDDKVAKLLNERWPELMRTAARFDTNPALRRFLLRHIDVVGLSAEEAQALAQRARTECPTTNTKLCNDIARVADETVKEATQ